MEGEGSTRVGGGTRGGEGQYVWDEEQEDNEAKPQTLN